jgi:hypothetical protein
MSVRVDVVCVSLALCVSMSGCKKDAATSSPNMDEAGEAKSAGDSDDPLAELAELEGRMRTFGLAVAGDKQGAAEGGDAAVSGGAVVETELPAEEAPAPTAIDNATEPPQSQGRDEIDYCGDLCSLRESICALEARICTLAEAHTDDTTYADACERAIEDCEVAGEACDTCG